MNEIETIERSQLREDIVEFQPGDTVKVKIEIKESSGVGEKRTVRTRTQAFQGLVIKRQGAGARETFTVRKISFGVGVERTFPVHSPIIKDIQIVQEGDVRRAKLYYIRDKVGKAARVKNKKIKN
ncbi:MAG: 50S ribosomal protein L19 [Candidatus Anoxymicrobium japonicum]|uniref:Large ribosomal subunit protein bL19 n=1 Tax=Candidatus Anoxymicrobium japonicum TaxID=2013648 RepID=A0A2N3G808_9ACTN|nr:MAG: 50S ribosomal protein L19 [Candidatus Anoxymicrobium japonicum]